MRRGVLTAALLALLPGAAHAGTVTLDVEREDQGHMFVDVWRTVHYVAAPGETNLVTLTMAADGILVRDTGAPVTAPADCTRTDANTVRCPAGPLPGTYASGAHAHAIVELGDGDDAVKVEGPGDTILDGAEGHDALAAGPGDDEITGGAGDDLVDGAAGDDLLNDTSLAVAEVDHYDGGPGRDWLTHDTASDWAVDLGAGTASTAGETDRVAGIEQVRGGPGDDTLTGTPGGDVLLGGGGSDTLIGDAGDDLLAPGTTRIYRGYGVAAQLGRWDRAGDSVACGAGEDTVATPHAADVLAGCEVMGSVIDPIALAPDPVAVTPTGVVLRVIALAEGKVVKLRLTARAGRRTVVVGRGRVRAAGDVALPLTRRGRALLARPGGLTVSVTARAREEFEQFQDDPTVVIRRLAFRTVL